jgi:hypothetical protein
MGALLDDDTDLLTWAKGLSTKRPATVGDDDSVATVVDDELTSLGYPGTSRLSILGDVGRENNWKRNIIFKGHSDPKNQSYNRGIISWQGDRRSALDNYLKQEGVLGRNDDDELRGMVRFMDTELKSKYPNVHKTLMSPKSTYDASEALRNYIKYVPDAPYNSPDPEFRVKNNAQWAKRAQKLGLGQELDVDAIWANINPLLAEDIDPDAVWAEIDDKGGIPSPPKPDAPIQTPKTTDGSIPETDETLNAQIRSALDPKVNTRFGVLTKSPEQNAIFANRSDFTMFPVQDGSLWVNTKKAMKKLGLKKLIMQIKLIT